ncbi:unnamed protein product [Linum trigynum]|uniref:Uncharacterized protein n=1 Tax=Linum trigynum TaxID=586398 RepID=A0AAV2D5J2_9ROSI
MATRVLKAKYYPNRDILHTQVGTNPSYTWRSILAAQDLIKKGMRWRVRDGTQVNIWEDRWVARAEDTGFKVTTTRTAKGELERVTDFIDHDLRHWKKDLLQQHFNPTDRVRI